MLLNTHCRFGIPVWGKIQEVYKVLSYAPFMNTPADFNHFISKSLPFDNLGFNMTGYLVDSRANPIPG
jgi:hypothetical protein